MCAFGQSKTFALTSIKKYVPSPYQSPDSASFIATLLPSECQLDGMTPLGVYITGSSDRCVHKVAQPTHVAER